MKLVFSDRKGLQRVKMKMRAKMKGKHNYMGYLRKSHLSERKIGYLQRTVIHMGIRLLKNNSR